MSDIEDENDQLCPGGCGRPREECVRQTASRDFCGDADFEDLDELDQEFGSSDSD